MRNFKKILLFVIILIIFESIAAFALEPVTYEYFFDKELAEEEKNGWAPDVVMVGNSSVMMGFVPEAFEESMSSVSGVVNAGTGAQMIWGSYYYLEELLKKYDVKHAVVGIEYNSFLETEWAIKRDLIVLDKIDSPAVKFDYIKNILEPEDYPQLIKSYRYRENIKDIPSNVKRKFSSDYRNGIDTGGSTFYKNKGYVYSEEKGPLYAGIYGINEWDEGRISPLALEYLKKIYDLCEDKGVNLHLVVTPVAFSGIYNMTTYQEAYNYFDNFAKERGIPFTDLNLIKDRTTILPDELLSDADHLGAKGAEINSRIYSSILQAEIEGKDTSPFFYNSVEEMKADIKGIVACDFKTEPSGDTGDRIIYAKSIHEENILPEYEYWVYPENGDEQWIKLQDYSEAAECHLPALYLQQDVRIKVNCREKGKNTLWDMQIERSRSPGM